MHTKTIVLSSLCALLLGACATTPSPEKQAAMQDDARKAAGSLMKQLGGTLKTTIQEKGPAEAIVVCKEKAPAIARSVAETHGIQVKRVTFKSRNPNSVPDAWETQALKAMEKQLAEGARPDTVEYSGVVHKGGKSTFRYTKALVMQEVCMTCHGTPETIPPAVQARLATEYPNDKATGYLPNMLRGAISIQRPL